MIATGWSAVQAAPRTVLVLPLDGNVDQATRARLNGSVQRVARTLPGAVTVADTTFDETAAAVGCDPSKAACAETVRATLAVDELVFGRATAVGGSTTLVVVRVRKPGAPLTVSTTVDENAPSLATETALGPAFGGAAPAPVPSPARDAAPPPPVPTARPAPASTRTRGVLLTVGGGVSLLAGLLLWANVSSAQDDIDAANPRDDDDFRALEDREDRAARNALLGDVLVVAGVGLAAWGVVTLYRDHEARRAITVAPQLSSTTAGLVLGGHW